MNTPEHLPKPEQLHEALDEAQAKGAQLKQKQVERVVIARVEALRSLIGKVSPSRYEALAAKVAREKQLLEGFVSRSERAHQAELARAQDLDERYFVKRQLNLSLI